MPRLREQGFTLLELLVVIAIMAVLGGIILTAVMRSYERSQVTLAKSMIEQLKQALQLYAEDWETYPPDDDQIGVGGFESSVSLVRALLSSAKDGPYANFPSDAYDTSSVAANKGLFDPWGNAYRYHWSKYPPEVTHVGQVSGTVNIAYNIWSIGPNGTDDEFTTNANYPQPPADGKQGDDVVSY